MLSLDPIHPRQSAILEILALEKVLNTEQLKKQLAEKDVLISQSSLYKLISKMVEKKMLLKKGEEISINSAWVKHIHHYAQLMDTTKNEPLHKPFEPKERRIFKGSSMVQFDNLRIHLSMFHFSRQQNEPVYTYCGHAFYIFLFPKELEQMYALFEQQKKENYFLYGNNTPLDQQGLKLHKKLSPYVYMTNKPPFPKQGYTLILCGEYFIEIFEPEPLKKHVADAFEKIRNPEDFDEVRFRRIQKEKMDFKLVMTRDKQRARELRGIFNPFLKTYAN